MQYKILLSFALLFSFTQINIAQEDNPIVGKWDLEVVVDGKPNPAWLEVEVSGYKTLVGRFVYFFGSARPVSHIKQIGDKYSFSIPNQWERPEGDMKFEFQVIDNRLKGTMIYTDGKSYDWTAVPAPKLSPVKNPIWGAPKQLFNGENLNGWRATGKNQWLAEDGILKSPASGSNIVTNEKFTDFKLHIEFKYPKDGNSGVYLRGRHEVQVADNQGDDPSSIKFGGIYGFLTPNQMVAKAPDEWQVFDITLVGHRVTIVANGVPIIENQIIPGITGGALDSKEGMPGPIMLQGDHGPVEYRNIVITPAISQD